jgi:phosphopantetheinyl transferase
MTRVLVLHARLSAEPDSGALAGLIERLPYAKRFELERRDPPARQASLAGISLALRGIELLRGSPGDASQLRFPAGGKPYLPGGPTFSVSHGRVRVGVAVSTENGAGFDLEEFDPASPEAGATRARLLRWTATEAVLKAAGRGLRDARAVAIDESLQSGRVGGASFHLLSVAIADDVVAHLATVTPVTSVAVEEVESSVLAWGG